MKETKHDLYKIIDLVGKDKQDAKTLKHPILR